MEDYIFSKSLDRFKSVSESTNYLEIISYSDSSYNTIEEQPLTPDEFDNFIYRRGVFAPAKLPHGVSVVAALRLIVQKNAQQPDTFAPSVISLTKDSYTAMVNGFHLPRAILESSSCVGPFFWCGLDHEENSHLQLIHRKSDVRKKGFTRGWEITLSHEFSTGITSGFCKGTRSSDIVECLNFAKGCVSDVGHPMSMPLMMFGFDSSYKTDIKQREARDWLRRLENAISIRNQGGIEDKEGYLEGGAVDLDAVHRDLVECHAQVLWKRPMAYIEISNSIEEGAKLFIDNLPDEKKSRTLLALHGQVLSKLLFYRKKWQGVEAYADVTLARLELQRNALINIITRGESEASFRMAGDQMKLAQASKRDSTAMKGISLLGTIFLPGAYLASIFSTTFFDFKDAPDIASTISPRFWVYWIVTIPVTVLIVGSWVIWDRRTTRKHNLEDLELERQAEGMERQIMSAMRARTLSRL